jgi:hypothetical protein
MSIDDPSVLGLRKLRAGDACQSITGVASLPRRSIDAKELYSVISTATCTTGGSGDRENPARRVFAEIDAGELHET